MNKKFSADFQKDILNLAEECYKNQTNNIIVSFDYGKCILDVNMTFRVSIKDEEEK